MGLVTTLIRAWTLFKKLGPQIPKEEWAVMDTVILHVCKSGVAPPFRDAWPKSGREKKMGRHYGLRNLELKRRNSLPPRSLLPYLEMKEWSRQLKTARLIQKLASQELTTNLPRPILSWKIYANMIRLAFARWQKRG